MDSVVLTGFTFRFVLALCFYDQILIKQMVSQDSNRRLIIRITNFSKEHNRSVGMYMLFPLIGSYLGLKKVADCYKNSVYSIFM